MNIGRILDVCCLVLVCTVVVLAVLLVGVRMFGLEPYPVLYDSMSPTYPRGSMVYSNGDNEAKPGENVTFVLSSTLTVVTHRVVRVQGNYYYTKGDANALEDPLPVHRNNVLGKPVFALPLLGYVSGFLSTRTGLIIAGMALTFLLLMLIVPELYRMDKNRSVKQ